MISFYRLIPPPPPLPPNFVLRSPTLSGSILLAGRRNFLPKALRRITRATYRVTKTYIVGKRLDFPDHRLAPDEGEASGERDRFYTQGAPKHAFIEHQMRIPRSLIADLGKVLEGRRYTADPFMINILLYK